jgi:hypothetical protein
MNPIKQNHDALLRTGAMALAAAGASTAAHAATVQITFNNSFVSTTSGIAALDTDVGGDLSADLAGMLGSGFVKVLWPVSSYGTVGFGGRAPNSGGFGGARVRGDAVVVGALAVAAGLVSVTLVDTGVNGGASTAGWLDVTATGRGVGEFGRVDVHRFIFDDTGLGAPAGVAHADAAYPEYVAAAVPEPSGMGLLALGAGGLLARRRRAMAA